MRQKGIIIKAVDYGESDKIITILNEHGAKVPLMARRAKKLRRVYKHKRNCLFMVCLFTISGEVWVR
ncbi:DNA recombination and repair protein RecO [Staphylococcus aureus]|nr:DNA recombination and repair protein RecO [Staphylococcus aureus]